MIEGLIVFFKSPRLGEVKTRLARTVGKERALEIYTGLVDMTMNQAVQWQNEQPHKRQIFPWGAGEREGFREIDLETAELQHGADLGIRMERAMRDVLRVCDRVAIIGVDCPWITARDIEQSFLGLQKKESRLGPCPDGGYWLMSTSWLPPCCLSNIPWSDVSTMARVSSRLEGFGMKVHYLRELNDVDEEEDLKGVASFS